MTRCTFGFSALQRAENSSILTAWRQSLRRSRFQCSSASRKFLNERPRCGYSRVCESFSALQRAENSSMCCLLEGRLPVSGFQCSSASRKFLNPSRRVAVPPARKFQCSSASRKFLNRNSAVPASNSPRVSVLFSEPKIPQFKVRGTQRPAEERFQCSSASRKFLNSPPAVAARRLLTRFSALQRAENSSMVYADRVNVKYFRVSVLFSEPKIPQSQE